MNDSLRIVPCTLRQAQAFVQDEHRTHDAAQGGLWALALMRDGMTSNGERVTELVGVAIAGRPVSAVLQAKGYCEIVRVCVIEGIPNGCSMLYARVRRVAQVMGYFKCVTYTLPSESGSSPSGAGFKVTGRTRGGSWDRRKRPRTDHHPTEPKLRWEAPT